MKSKKAAMEMSVGTIVTIVLLVTVLILGLVLIRTIFKTSVENIEGIDQAIKNEIQKLFTDTSGTKIVIYPTGRLISIKKGNDKDLGFAISIRNVEIAEGRFRYIITVDDPNIRRNCNINEQEAERYIVAGGEGTITLPPGEIMDLPEFVRFRIPEGAPPCLIRYAVNVKKDGVQYTPTVHVDVKIEGN